MRDSSTLHANPGLMKRIAAPMIGGVMTSAILELLIYPVIYVIWRRRDLPDQSEEQTPLIPPALVPAARARQLFLHLRGKAI
jgi:hypothetical protein